VADLDIDSWVPFGAAMLGAAAVLVGLIFVALSINLDSLLRAPWVLRRAAAAIALLMTVLVASTFLLVPGQSRTALGLEMGLTGVVGLIVITLLLVRGSSVVDPPYRRHFQQAAIWSLGIQAIYIVCGVSLLLKAGGGLYWLVPAVLLGLVRAVLDSWVLLVEVKR
jgi:modulator of FtsH protease